MDFHEISRTHAIKLPHALGGFRWAALAIATATAIAARFFPLVDDLHYEFSALCALLFSLLGGLAAIYPPRRQATTERSLPSPPEAWHLVGTSTLLSLAPLAVPLICAPFDGSCGIADGVAWYLLLVPTSAAISAVLALLALAAVRRRWVALALFLLLWLVSLLRGAVEAYTGPHIFLYAWQTGFFPGGSWDAELPITPLLVIYRTVHLAVALALLSLAAELLAMRRSDAVRPRPALLLLCALAAAAGLLLVPQRSELGLTRTDAWLRAELGDSLNTRFATIYYNAATADSLDIWRAANLTDFYISEHAHMLFMAEREIPHISLYLFASAAEQKRCVGTASAAFTKPWDDKLCMPFDRVGGTLRHELAHIMLASYGNALGISWSQGMLEGSATAMENAYGWRTLHQYARAMYAFKLAPPVEEIMSFGGFSSYRSSVSYVLAGSFSRWLIDSFGVAKYLRAYPSADFEGAYGMPLEALAGRYRRFLASLPEPPASYRATMRNMFGGGSFFSQRCLRRIGTLNGEGFNALAEERYADALRRFEGSLDEGISYGARSGVIRALWGMGSFKRMLDSCALYGADTASYPLLPYLIEQGDAWWALGDTAHARRLYDSAHRLDINEPLTLRSAQRLYFLNANDSLARLMRAYFTRPSRLQTRLALLDAAIAVDANTPRDRMLLGFMRGMLTINAMPVTSMGYVEDAIRAARRELDAGAPPIDSLRGALCAEIFTLLIDRAADATILQRTREPILRSFDDDGVPIAREGSPAWNTTSTAFREERRRERVRFVQYVLAHQTVER